MAADAASWYCCAFVLVLLILLASVKENNSFRHDGTPIGRNQLLGRQGSGGGAACNEIYVVGEGETLHTISDKCGDPFIIEQNPHIHDPDDVFPGLVIKITPSFPKK